MADMLEKLVFRFRAGVLFAVIALTAWTGWHALHVMLKAEPERLIPSGHAYLQTIRDHEEALSPANRILIALQDGQGEIWNRAFLSRLKDLTEGLAAQPGIEAQSIRSLWPVADTGIIEPVIAPGVTADALTQADLARIRARAQDGGHVGTLVARDFRSALIEARLSAGEIDETGGTGTLPETLMARAAEIEHFVRDRFEDERFTVHLAGPAFGHAAIAERAVLSAGLFFAALFVTGLLIYGWWRSVMLSVLPLLSTLIALVWLLGALAFMGRPLDPIAMPALFLAFAAGIGHGLHQLHRIAALAAEGKTSLQAARAAFGGLLVPGIMGLAAALAAFSTFWLSGIPLLQDVTLAAAAGLSFQVVSQLILLPVLVSYKRFSRKEAARFARQQAWRQNLTARGRVMAGIQPATAALFITMLIFVLALHRGDAGQLDIREAGVAELPPDAPQNLDAGLIAANYTHGLNRLIVAAETRAGACVTYATMDYLDRLSWHLANVPGVQSVISAPEVAKTLYARTHEGSLKWRALPRSEPVLAQITASIPPATGLLDKNCTLLPLHIYTDNLHSITLQRLTAAVRQWERETRAEQSALGVTLRLAGGQGGILAAAHETLKRAQWPMLLCLAAALIAILFAGLRDWRLTVAGIVPAVVTAALAFAFIKEFDIPLTGPVLAVLVLGLGVCAQNLFHLLHAVSRNRTAGQDFAAAYTGAWTQTGIPLIVSPLILALACAVWIVSPLRAHGGMALLLAFLLPVGMLLSVTVAPAAAAVLDLFAPPRPDEEAQTPQQAVTA